jgi:hypothetical protein
MIASEDNAVASEATPISQRDRGSGAAADINHIKYSIN